MKFQRMNRGVTLIELMIVVSIMIILSGLAGWTAHRLFPKYRSKAAAVEFAKYTDLCRMHSIRTNRECRITILASESTASATAANIGQYSISLGDKSINSTAWDILPEDTFIDSSDDLQHQGIIDLSDGEHKQHDVSLVYSSGDIGGPRTGLSDSIIFSPKGYIINPSTDFNSEGYIEIAFASNVALAEGIDDVYVVMITKFGMTRLDNSLHRRHDDFFSGTASATSL
jgi:prepilin-type N-terminal cleavage/methylation domain-containing protein